MKLLVVDDDIDFRKLAGVLLARSFPRATMTEYDPQQRGLPPEDFPWADFDVVLLDHDLNADQTGLDWLRRFGKLPGFPAVIFTTGAGDENLAARAMKFGADEYLSKRDVSAERLGELLTSVLAERSDEDPLDGGLLQCPTAAAEGTAREVGGFTLRRALGCGGTADVYLADRRADGLTVVVKVLRSALAGSATAIARFVHEARVLADVRGSEVVRVYEHGVDDGLAYLAMEYLGHGDLSARIAEGIAPAQALDYTRAIGEGLTTVHEHRIVHRDLKPANVMFRYDDSLALTDFGISRHADFAMHFTTTGNVVGTPSYMSPEQIEGDPVDARSDLYSLGVMLFEMLAGMRPFLGDSPPALFNQHVSAPVPRLPSDVAAVQRVVDRLLAKRPADRYPSARALLSDLERVSV